MGVWVCAFVGWGDLLAAVTFLCTMLDLLKLIPKPRDISGLHTSKVAIHIRSIDLVEVVTYIKVDLLSEHSYF